MSQQKNDSVFTESVPEQEMDVDRVDDFLFTSPFTSTTFFRRKRLNQQPQHRYMTLYCQDYVFRAKTKAVFEDAAPYYVFDFFVLGEQKFDEFFLFENVWRETLLLNKFHQEHVKAVAHAVENQLAPPVLRTLRVKQVG